VTLLFIPSTLLAVLIPMQESAGTPPHSDSGTTLVLALAIILAAAKLGGHLAERLEQPAVLGELLVGVLLGSLEFAGVSWFRALTTDVTLDGLAGIGVVVLLFEVGLESTVKDMQRVGWRAFIVATLGVVTPWVLGWGVGALMLPNHSVYVHVFLGATLTATSVGITARVLRDLGRSSSAEARIILGAAVIDDVMGLVILAVVGSLIQAADLGTTLSLVAIGWLVLKAVGFLFGALWLGGRMSPLLFGLTARLRGTNLLLVTALVFCFMLAAAAAAIGLAPIVGAYAAGLILEDVHYQQFAERGEHALEELVRPIASFLVPIFFVLMGLRVDLRVLGDTSHLGLMAALILAAVAGKQACALGGLGGRLDKLSIGIGMIPRGEVGLIFASMGLGMTVHGERIVDAGIYSTVVVMVMVTTVVTPPALKWSLGRWDRRGRGGSGGG
jgi:Kef-type K+ transport system membrane component KefB